MPRRTSLPAGPYLVVGLGQAGVAAIRALCDAAGPREVAACDVLMPAPSADAVAELRARGAEIEAATDGLLLFDRIRPRCVVKSPGVPFDAPVLARAGAAGVPILDELELGWRLGRAPVIGVTGTNGKSTVSSLIAAVLQASGRDTRVVGNTEFGPPLSGVWREAEDWLVCEISSYQLEGCPRLLPEVSVITNLRPDHLQRHGDMRRYGACKRRLFVRGRRSVGLAVVNGDDAFASTLAPQVAARGGVVSSFGRSPGCDFRLRACGWTSTSAWLVADTPDGPLRLDHRLPGAHNAENMLAAIATARGLGLSWETMVPALERAAGVPGRFEAIDEGQPFDVIVDFAHTPDAIEAVVGAAREIAEARGAQVHALLSVAGNRPTGLHAPIGAAAARLAHSLIVTGGSLRGGSPATTLGPLLAGARSARAAPVDLVPDRRTAICEALARAAKDDVVLLLGRGARPRLSRDLAGNGPAFDDRVVAREELRALLDREFTPLPLDPAALGR